MQARAGQPRHSRQIGDLQWISGVLLDVRIQRGIGQAANGVFRRLRVIQTGQQQHRALLGNQWIADRTVCQPADQLTLPRIQRQARRLIEQTMAGVGMLAQ
ncbi:hypothetical protein D3C81_1373470 [compost metagenome]